MNTEFDFEKRYRLVREIIETIVLTLLMFLIIRLAVQNFNVDGHSMEPNLHDKELILVDKWSYLFRPPTRGDIVVFDAPPAPGTDYVKRVIGLPGDVITIQNTTVYVNGKQIKDPYVSPANQGNPFDGNLNLPRHRLPFASVPLADRTDSQAGIENRVVPPGAYFVLGDNRGDSSDSRDWGCVPQQKLIGRAALVYWPLQQDNNGLVPNVASAFNDIPQPDMQSTTPCPIIKHPDNAPQKVFVSDNQKTGLSTNMALMLIMPVFFVMYPRKRKRNVDR